MSSRNPRGRSGRQTQRDPLGPGCRYRPGATASARLSLSRVLRQDELRLSAGDSNSITLRAGDSSHRPRRSQRRTITDLADRRRPPRPKVALIGRTIDPGPSEETIRLRRRPTSSGRESFPSFCEPKSATFPRNQQIEVETEDGSFKVVLSLDDGTLILEDSQNMIAELDPRLFGRSAFGPFDSVRCRGNQRRLATSRHPGTSSLPYCNSLPWRSAKECTPKRLESFPDRLGRIGRDFREQCFGTVGICEFRDHCPATERNTVVREAQGQPCRSKRRHSAGHLAQP